MSYQQYPLCSIYVAVLMWRAYMLYICGCAYVTCSVLEFREHFLEATSSASFLSRFCVYATQEMSITPYHQIVLPVGHTILVKDLYTLILCIVNVSN